MNNIRRLNKLSIKQFEKYSSIPLKEKLFPTFAVVLPNCNLRVCSTCGKLFEESPVTWYVEWSRNRLHLVHAFCSADCDRAYKADEEQMEERFVQVCYEWCRHVIETVLDNISYVGGCPSLTIRHTVDVFDGMYQKPLYKASVLHSACIDRTIYCYKCGTLGYDIPNRFKGLIRHPLTTEGCDGQFDKRVWKQSKLIEILMTGFRGEAEQFFASRLNR